jgi:hypothetical protein
MYSGQELKTHASDEYRLASGQLQCSTKTLAICGLNISHNDDLKNIFKGANTSRWAAVLGATYRA